MFLEAPMCPSELALLFLVTSPFLRVSSKVTNRECRKCLSGVQSRN